MRNILREVVLQDREISIDLQRMSKSTNHRLDSINSEISKTVPHMKQIQAGYQALDTSSQIKSRDSTRYTKLVPQSNADQCKGLCLCLCHRPISLASPSWAKGLLGTLLLSWSGVLGRPMCSEKRCRRPITNMLYVDTSGILFCWARNISKYCLEDK